MANQNIKKFYQHSNKQYYYLPHAVGHGAPTTIPEDAGLMYIDVDTQDIYVSAGKSNVADWQLINGGSGPVLNVYTNTVPNQSQVQLDLTSGTGINITNPVGGVVQFDIDPATVKQFIYSNQGGSVTTDGGGTYVDIGVPELILTTEINYIYSFRAMITYRVSNTAVGLTWALNGSDPAPTRVSYYSYGSGTTTNSFFITTGNSTFNQPTTFPGVTPNAAGNIAIIEGTYIPSIDGQSITVSVRDDGGFPQTVTIDPGSYIEFIKYPV
jgi:hypothetical protein